MIGIVYLLGSIAYASRNTRLELSPDGLTIRGGVYGRTIPAASLIAQEAKRVDLSGDSEYRLRIRTNGAALPGYQAGWFRLGNREKALVFVTDRDRVVYVPTSQGYAILLSVAQPEEFLAALTRTLPAR